MKSALAFALATLRAEAETTMREENGPATRTLRSGLDKTWENVTDQPVEKAFAAIHQQSEMADAAARSGDDFTARKIRAMQKLEIGSAVFGVVGLSRSLVKNFSKITM